MLGARPEPLNLSLPPQLALDLAPSAPPARAGSCLGAKRSFKLPARSARLASRARPLYGGAFNFEQDPMAEPQGGHVAAPRSPLALVLVRSAATMPGWLSSRRRRRRLRLATYATGRRE